MNGSLSRARSKIGFTLIELLTVITIIAILMAMLFPIVNAVMETARKRKALTDSLSIAHAVEQYAGEYGQMPKVDPDAAPPNGPIADDHVGDPAAGMIVHNANLFNILRDIDRAPNAGHSQNSRQQSYLEGRVASSGSRPRDGFVETAGANGVQGAFYDPWGSQYNIVLDSNSDNVLDVKNFYQDFADDAAPRRSFGVFALGKDRQLGKRGDKRFQNGSDMSDDVLSWASH